MKIPNLASKNHVGVGLLLSEFQLASYFLGSDILSDSPITSAEEKHNIPAPINTAQIDSLSFISSFYFLFLNFPRRKNFHMNTSYYSFIKKFFNSTLFEKTKTYSTFLIYIYQLTKILNFLLFFPLLTKKR